MLSNHTMQVHAENVSSPQGIQLQYSSVIRVENFVLRARHLRGAAEERNG